MILWTEADAFGDGGIKTLPLGNVFLLRPQKHQPPSTKHQINLFFKESTTIPQTKNSTENNKLI